MNWIKKNPVLTGIAIFFAIVILALAYLVFNASSRLAEVNQSYDDEVRKLQRLQTRQPFPNNENLEKSAAALEHYTEVINELKTNLAGRQLDAPDITPQGFQDRLRQEVSGVQQRASANEVQLGQDFYLGFNAYQNSLPEQEAAPLLARQLEEILYVTNTLIDLRVQAIEAINRQPLPEESGLSSTPTPTPTPRGKRPRKAEEPAEPTGPVVIKRPFDVVFRAEQGQFRQAFNALLDAPDFLIVRAMNIQNSAQEGPLINDPTAASAAATPRPAAQGGSLSPAQLLEGAGEAPADETDRATDLRMVVGRETLLVVLRLEALQFNFPADSDKEESSRQAATAD